MSGGHLYTSHPEIQYPKKIEQLQNIIRNANKKGRKVTIIVRAEAKVNSLSDIR